MIKSPDKLGASLALCLDRNKYFENELFLVFCPYSSVFQSATIAWISETLLLLAAATQTRQHPPYGFHEVQSAPLWNSYNKYRIFSPPWKEVYRKTTVADFISLNLMG